MAVDIGAEAIDRGTFTDLNWTEINETNPATASGTITSIDIWANSNITGLKVGTFYLTGTNKLKCRDSEAIAGTITAGSKVTKAVSIAVEIDDYIGFYCDAGRIERDSSGYVSMWVQSGDHADPGDETTYLTNSGDAFSLGGYLGVAGWTGKISGVTNPAKIMGVDVANIAKVKGVVSG